MKLAALVLVLIIGVARAHVEIEPALYSETYSSLNEAAVAAIGHAYDFSNAYEYGGVIMETKEHTFRVSIPTTSWWGDGLKLDYTNDWDIYTVVADYHTHPCMPFSHYPAAFSNSDVATNIRYKLIGILGDLCSGEVHEYIPGISELDVRWGDDEYGSHGKIVGTIELWRVPAVVEEYPGPLRTHEW